MEWCCVGGVERRRRRGKAKADAEDEALRPASFDPAHVQKAILVHDMWTLQVVGRCWRPHVSETKSRKVDMRWCVRVIMILMIMRYGSQRKVGDRSLGSWAW